MLWLFPTGRLAMHERERKTSNGISRRRMLKRIGAGAAIAWSAPILSSIRTPAFAQYGDPRCPACTPLGETGSEHCAGQADCGAEGSGNPCACLRTSGNTCACHSCVFCDNPAIVACSSQADCPAGWICAMSCCSDPGSVDDFRCHPACGGGDNPDPCVVGRRTGRTSMG